MTTAAPVPPHGPNHGISSIPGPPPPYLPPGPAPPPMHRFPPIMPPTPGHPHPHPHQHPPPPFHPYPMDIPNPLPQASQMPPPSPLPPSPGRHFTSLDQIESRLKQLEEDEMHRMEQRRQVLARRGREDEEFRRVTEQTEVEEEDLRRQRKRLKRESMGLFNSTSQSPPLRPGRAQGQRQTQPTPPRSLSETTAATTLAYFKQQSPHPPAAPAPAQAPTLLPPHLPSQQSHPYAPPPIAPNDPFRPQDPSLTHSHTRKKQKYTIRNTEAWGERHGRPASLSSSGKALWKRPSDGALVYLVCPVNGCGKADFGTLHGFMCHLTKKHKDRTLGSQSRALEVCGVVCRDGAVEREMEMEREESRGDGDRDGEGRDAKGYQHQELEYSSASNSEEEGEIRTLKMKMKTEDVHPPLSMHLPAREDVNRSMETETPSRQMLPSGLETSGLPSSRSGNDFGTVNENDDGGENGNTPMPSVTERQPSKDAVPETAPQKTGDLPVQMEAEGMQTG